MKCVYAHPWCWGSVGLNFEPRYLGFVRHYPLKPRDCLASPGVGLLPFLVPLSMFRLLVAWFFSFDLGCYYPIRGHSVVIALYHRALISRLVCFFFCIVLSHLITQIRWLALEIRICSSLVRPCASIGVRGSPSPCPLGIYSLHQVLMLATPRVSAICIHFYLLNAFYPLGTCIVGNFEVVPSIIL
jgi:hypothetical protein